MTRRGLLALLGGALGVIAGLALSPLARRLLGDRKRDETAFVVRHVLEAVDRSEGARALGQAVLETMPPDTTAGALVFEIASRLETNLWALTEMSAEALRARLAAQVRAEHVAGETLSIQGWELSVTEARLYALAASG